MKNAAQWLADTFKDFLKTVTIPLNRAADSETIQEVVNEAYTTAVSFVCDVFLADGPLNPGESEALNGLFRSSRLDLNRNARRVLFHAEKWKSLSSQVPRFLTIAIRFDTQSNQTNLAALIVGWIDKIGNWAALSDGEIVPQEQERIDGYVNFLNGHLGASGVPVAVKQTTSERDKISQRRTKEQVCLTDSQSRAERLDNLMAELEKFIGLSQVKQDVSSLVNVIRIRKLREEKGMQVPPMSLHLVFTGNPGTGKTTVARLLARIYRAMGLLSKGHLVETDRAGMVAGYVGQTAIKVTEKVKAALGGVLFIDEAYSLVSSKGDSDYGREAIDTLLKLMEDNRKDLVVIVAGYTDLMQQFLESNPGLRSRFNKFIEFPEYKPQELYDIFVSLCTQAGYTFDEECANAVLQIFETEYAMRQKNFGNGRLVRNIFERALTNQANRVAAIAVPSQDDLQTLTIADMPQIRSERPPSADIPKLV